MQFNQKKFLLMLIDLLGGSVFSEESSENSLSSHPEDLNGHSGVSGTFSLTGTSVSTYMISENKNISLFEINLFLICDKKKFFF